MKTLKKYAAIMFIGLFSIIAKAEDRPIGDLRVTDGSTQTTVTLTKAMMDALPKTSITTSTAWTPKEKFTGTSFKDILTEVGITGKIVRVHALNDYWVDIPMSDVDKYNIILASKRNDTPLKVRDFGPYFVIYPLDEHYEELNKPIFYSRFVWQVEHITVDPK
ncbi:oxidoreductase [Serratia marcescens]|uniref:molybdopterin-dependent oxidoreductase n=1 Tax=Serratia TaxID=613 RepID=UPI000F73CD02|nr:molybdopterin-dependent oxidoreductase [Serratia marcescens]RRU14455.1 oxidoreductase [Serratia marcescens]RRU16504.1 oxidoreductase [Serratia marcescens]RRU26408.1 oxidoreductase [Serratia marcescens]RRU27906.1 oxidoreductase [Serratia marcescens]RRU39793.1 oxidoreductase [Serratia marcescens]